MIRLVVLDHNGGDNVVRCFDHLAALDWPADDLDLVLVDNASSDGSAARVRARHRAVRVIRCEVNVGFPANNLALTDLTGIRYVGLVNDDAFVTPSYLGPLVAALDADPGLGAVSPQMQFESRFLDVDLLTTTSTPGRGDERALGVLLRGLKVDGEDRWVKAEVREGGWGPERGRGGTHEWTGARARLRVPVPRKGAGPWTARLLVSALEPRSLHLECGTDALDTRVGPEPAWVHIPLTGAPYDVVNNAGVVVHADGHGADRGLGRLPGDLAEPADLFAWSGGAVLLRPAFLRQVGLFEPRFFLYYEDTDLSWRGQAQGWRYRYVPEAVVHHVHAATTQVGSPAFQRYNERNRLLMLVRNAPAPLARAQLVGFARSLAAAVGRDVVRPVLARRRPNPEPSRRLAGALAATIRELPPALRARRRLRAAQTVSDERLLAQLVPVGEGRAP